MKTTENRILQRLKIPYEGRALITRNRKADKLLAEGRYWLYDPKCELKVYFLDRRDVRIGVPDLRALHESGLLAGETEAVDLASNERGLLWVEGRLQAILEPGLHLLWTGPKRIQVDRVDADALLRDGERLRNLMQLPGVEAFLQCWEIPEGSKGVIYRNGRQLSLEGAGSYGAWKGRGSLRMSLVDCREQSLEITGQELLTADRVTLRLNFSLVCMVTDVMQYLSSSVDARDALYREAQLQLRAEVGGRSLDELLSEKEQLSARLIELLQTRAKALGLQIRQAGLRDIILPGDMKDMLNQVILAGKQAEANSILRREETAAMRSQLNTAKLIRDNPTLMRLRELEVLEKVAAQGTLNVILGEQGLTDRLTKLI